MERQIMGISHARASLEQSISERISEFLRRCNKRGHSHPLHQKQFPNYTRLAKLCFCNKSTITRIATGEQSKVDKETLDVICALSGISPPASLKKLFLHCEEMQERQRRLEDAEEAVNNGANSVGDVTDAIMFGIQQRVKELHG
tara:strand:+ start:29516 stop:29947 length:432 start_codon:yes stop_codon:yes gene_type:complete